MKLIALCVLGILFNDFVGGIIILVANFFAKVGGLIVDLPNFF